MWVEGGKGGEGGRKARGSASFLKQLYNIGRYIYKCAHCCYNIWLPQPFLRPVMWLFLDLKTLALKVAPLVRQHDVMSIDSGLVGTRANLQDMVVSFLRHTPRATGLSPRLPLVV